MRFSFSIFPYFVVFCSFTAFSTLGCAHEVAPPETTAEIVASPSPPRATATLAVELPPHQTRIAEFSGAAQSDFELPIPTALPAPPFQKPLQGARAGLLRGKIERGQIFAAYDELIELHKRAGLYDLAAQLERRQAPLYRGKGLPDAAIIHENNARDLETRLQAFCEVQVPAKQVGKLYTGAPVEPILGCYNGAFIDRDDTLGAPWTDENWQTHRTGAQFRAHVGKNPGSLFMYLAYGRPFPKRWCEALKAEGIIPHIAWEPENLNAVRDDEFLQDFALQLRALDWPVFIRFASEMNGSWTAWGGNPRLYREKFALVHRALHRHAPRVATIWCVNNPPLGNAFDYYPGDANCDWVGVNFYSVPFTDGRRDRPAFDQNPLGLLEPIYQRYAARKPMAICEFAASHQSGVDNKIIADFAISKIRTLYGALPLLYPRVKLINWFSMNTIKYPTPGKTRNNYDLSDDPRVLRAWRHATDAAHFLSSRQVLGTSLPPVARPLGGQIVRAGSRLHFYTRSFDSGSRVFAQLGDKLVFAGRGNGAFQWLLQAPEGPQTLKILVYDSKNRFQKQLATRFIVQ